MYLGEGRVVARLDIHHLSGSKFMRRTGMGWNAIWQCSFVHSTETSGQMPVHRGEHSLLVSNGIDRKTTAPYLIPVCVPSLR